MVQGGKPKGFLGLDSTPGRGLEEVVKLPRTTGQLKRARALLWADEGAPITGLARRLRVTRQSLHNWVRRISQRNGLMAERLLDAPRSGRPRDKADLTDEVIPKLLRTHPAEHGYRAGGWTNPLPRDHAPAQYALELSCYTIQQAIKRAAYCWKRPRYVLCRRSKTWRRAKGR